MSWTDIMQLAQGTGGFWTIVGVALLGVGLLWILRPLLARHLGKRAALLLAVDIDAEDEREPVEIENEEGVSSDLPDAAAVPASRALAAYAAQAGAEKTPMRSSPGINEPIIASGEKAAVACPPELSRRIDRIEARVRARRTGIRG